MLDFRRTAKVLEAALWRRASDQTSRIVVDTSSGLFYNAAMYLTSCSSQLQLLHRSMHMSNAQDRLALAGASIMCSPSSTPFLLRAQLLTRV
jgi:hypothetical protein